MKRTNSHVHRLSCELLVSEFRFPLDKYSQLSSKENALRLRALLDAVNVALPVSSTITTARVTSSREICPLGLSLMRALERYRELDMLQFARDFW